MKTLFRGYWPLFGETCISLRQIVRHVNNSFIENQEQQVDNLTQPKFCSLSSVEFCLEPFSHV